MSGCHNPYTKDQFHLVRGLIKRVESLQDSRENHMKIIKELSNKIAYLEEEILSVKAVSEITFLNVKDVNTSFDKPKEEYTCPKCQGLGHFYIEVSNDIANSLNLPSNAKKIVCELCSGKGVIWL